VQIYFILLEFAIFFLLNKIIHACACACCSPEGSKTGIPLSALIPMTMYPPAPIVQIVGEGAYRVNHFFGIPALFELQALPLDGMTVD
jgi:hypothetical protein